MPNAPANFLDKGNADEWAEVELTLVTDFLAPYFVAFRSAFGYDILQKGRMPLLSATLIGLPTGLAVVAAVFLIRQLSTKPSKVPFTTEWITELSVDRYRPMLRLLGEDDMQFLRSQPGYNPRLESKVRTKRCRIFLDYLEYLDTDFKRTCAALKMMMLQSNSDRPDLALILLKSQVNFAWGVLGVQFQVVLYRFGVANVNIGGLFELFDSMRIELRTLAPASAGAR